MKKNNFAIFEIVCYVVAAVLGIVALYMAYENIAYINEYAAAYGATFFDLGSQAFQSIISAFVPYFTYAFVVFGIGRIYHHVAAPKWEEVIDLDEEFIDGLVAAIEAPAEEAAEEAIEEVVEEAVPAEETVEAPAEVVVEEPVEAVAEAAEEQKAE